MASELLAELQVEEQEAPEIEGGNGASEKPATTQDAFKTLKNYFGLELPQNAQCLAVDDSRRAESLVIQLGGKQVKALLFEYMSSPGGNGKAHIEERLMVTVTDDGPESRWVVCPRGVVSFNSSAPVVNINGTSVVLDNPGYPIAGWVDDAGASQPEEFNNLVFPLVETLKEAV